MFENPSRWLFKGYNYHHNATTTINGINSGIDGVVDDVIVFATNQVTHN